MVFDIFFLQYIMMWLRLMVMGRRAWWV